MRNRALAVLLLGALLGASTTKSQGQPIAASCFGSDVGAASVDWNGHFTWAQQHSVADVESNLKWKVASVFQCDALADSELFAAFSDLSVVIGHYAPDPACFGGDAGAASTNRGGHYAWASQRPRQQILENLQWKLDGAVRCIGGAQFSSYFADLSVILAHYGGESLRAPVSPVPMSARPAQICFDPHAFNAAAITACTQVIQSGATGDDLETAYYKRGTSYLDAGQVDQAISDLSQALSIDNHDDAALNNRGIAYNDKGQFDKAIADFTLAISLYPKDADAYANRGNVYANEHEYDAAIADYTRAISLDPKDARRFNNRGNVYNAKAEYDKAITDLSQAILLDPQYATAYENRGVAYANKDEYDKAIADYTQAVALDSKYFYAYSNRGIAYNSKGEYDKAIADFTQAISIYPKYEFAYNGRGNSYRDKGQYREAIADYTQAISLDPKFALAYRNRGGAYVASANLAAAANDFMQAISLSPTDAYSVLWLHIARMKQGRSDASELAANRAKLAVAKWPMPLVNFYLGKSTPNVALSAATNEAQRCEAAFYVGEWRLAQRQTAAAGKLFEQAAIICPKNYVELWAARPELSRAH